MVKPPFSCAVVLLLALGTGLAHAEKADRDKPMNVEADALRYDDAQQVSVFTGRVVLTKGTIVIRGGKVDVRQDPQGNQFGVVTAEPGRLAFFRQKREALDEFIEGEAQTIDYDGRADTVKFVGNARLRRLVGSQVNDEFKAEVIHYNNVTEVFTLDGAAAPVGQVGAPAGRVRALLTPKVDAAAAASSAPSSAAAPGVPLRESTTLRGARP